MVSGEISFQEMGISARCTCACGCAYRKAKKSERGFSVDRGLGVHVVLGDGAHVVLEVMTHERTPLHTRFGTTCSCTRGGGLSDTPSKFQDDAGCRSLPASDEESGTGLLSAESTLK